MTQQDLEIIFEQIRTNKKSVRIRKRELVNAFRYEKRTKWNVAHINSVLNHNEIETFPNYEYGNIDHEVELRYKPSNTPPAGFKLYSLSINKYKNLSDVTINFENTRNYCAFIGLNGSGKSNILEAISAIFSNLHHLTLPNSKDKLDFSYTICYALDGKYYQINDGKLDSLEKLNSTMLPKNIIASYSGEDTRLWERFYKPIYDRYCGKLTAEQQGFAPPFLFYINREQWEIAMLVLLYSEDIDVGYFTRGIMAGRNCTISFDFENRNLSKWMGTATEAFIEEIKKKQAYTIEEFRNTINSISFIDQSSTLFYYLYRSSTGKENRLVSKINISFGDGSSLEALSEGEKRMILANTIIHILATDNSLCLFDEPDSHIHISRKSELIKLIDNEKRYSILTTHSPVFLEKMKSENIQFVNNGKIEPVDKLKQIVELTNGEFNYFEGAFILSSKHTVVVEGTDDIKYIKKAIEIHSNEDPKYKELNKVAFIPQGSAGHTESFFKDIIINLLPRSNKVLYIFDYDQAGVDGWKKIENNKATYSTLDNIFYQEDYTTAYDSSIKIPQIPFYVEDFFHEDSYSSIVGNLPAKMNKYKEFKSRSNLHTSIKNHIEKNHNDFDKKYYVGFKPLLDKMLEIFFNE